MLPNAILADITVHDALHTGSSHEGMFFAARTFLQKIGSTLGAMLFASLTNFGRSPGDDLGVRLSGPSCVVVLLLASIAFWTYDEQLVLQQIQDASMDASGDKVQSPRRVVPASASSEISHSLS